MRSTQWSRPRHKSFSSWKLIIGISVVLLSTKFTQAATIVVPAGGDLQSAINGAQCGDLIMLQSGATWDTPGNFQSFTLPARACTASNPITIQSSGQSALPNGRVSPADASNMARIRTTGEWPAFSSTANAKYWILDGLEITDNITTAALANQLLDFGVSN